MTLATYPLNDTDYTAEDAALFHSTRTTGIFADDDFTFSLSGADNTIKLGVGLAWMRLARFKGMVAAMKTETSVDMGLPDSVYPRIDHVVLQYDANKNTVEVVVKNGTAASSPQPPERSTTEALYEIHLLRVRREPGAASISVADVTDLRLDANYCGLMADSVTKVDTSAINAQAMALIEKLQEEIANVKAGTAYVMKSGDTMTGPLNLLAPTEAAHAANKKYVDGKLISVSVPLPSANWADNLQTVDVAGVTADPSKSDVLASPDPADDNYAAYNENGVRIYAQLDGAVTFKCDSVPSVDLIVNVMVRT